MRRLALALPILLAACTGKPSLDDPKLSDSHTTLAGSCHATLLRMNDVIENDVTQGD